MQSQRPANLRQCGFKTALGFTLVELLVVIGIIAVLASILMPAISNARASANLLTCASNMRQICTALTEYANDYNGRYPINVATPAPGQFWYDMARMGQYLPNQVPGSNNGIKGQVLMCPEDSGALRSYAMNLWASAEIDALYITTPPRGTLWASNVCNASQMILLVERWSYLNPDDTGWVCSQTSGFVGLTVGEKFGAGGGVSPLMSFGRWGQVNCEIPWMRHRRNGNGSGTSPQGRANFGFADGHVETLSDGDVADQATGLSTLRYTWSPLDPTINP